VDTVGVPPDGRIHITDGAGVILKAEGDALAASGDQRREVGNRLDELVRGGDLLLLAVDQSFDHLVVSVPSAIWRCQISLFWRLSKSSCRWFCSTISSVAARICSTSVAIMAMLVRMHWWVFSAISALLGGFAFGASLPR
jgi:hypothetical protein